MHKIFAFMFLYLSAAQVKQRTTTPTIYENSKPPTFPILYARISAVSVDLSCARILAIQASLSSAWIVFISINNIITAKIIRILRRCLAEQNRKAYAAHIIGRKNRKDLIISFIVSTDPYTPLTK